MKLFFQRLSLLMVVFAISSVSLLAQVEIGGTTYLTLKSAFDAINDGTHQGNVVIKVNGNTTETATAVLNASGEGSASYTSVTIYPTVAATISGGVANALVQLLDADNVTIDGRIDQLGTINSLTFENTTTSSTSVIRLSRNSTAGDGAKNVTLRNLNVVGGTPTTFSVYGILVGMSSGLTTGAAGNDNLKIFDNNFMRAYYGIRIIGATTADLLGLEIKNNKFGNNSTFGDGHMYPIDFSYTDGALVENNEIMINYGTSSVYPLAVRNSKNGIVRNNLAENIVSGLNYGYYFAASTLMNVYGNTIQNCQGSTVYPYYLTTSTNNTFSNGTIRNITASGTLYGVYVLSTSANNTFTNFTIENLVSTSTFSAVAGIFLSSGINNTFQNFEIKNITGNRTVYGAYFATATGSSLLNSVIENIVTQTSLSTNTAYGVYVAGTATGMKIVNNSISGIFDNGVNNTTVANIPTGIMINNSSTVDVYFNSVNMYGSNSGGNATAGNSAAFAIAGTSLNGFNVRNNVFVNTMTDAVTTSKSYSMYLAAAANLTNSTFNNNNYFVSGANGVLFGIATDDYLSLNDWQTATTGQDLNSLIANPIFNDNVNLRPFIGSPLVGQGAPIQGYSNDLLGTVRTATPTIGAYEETGDFAPPSIVFTPLANTALQTNRILNANITDLSGVNTTTNAPRIYYKKATNANTYVDNTNATDGWKYTVGTGTAPDFAFTIDYTLIQGGIAAGDVIEYLIIAQDNSANAQTGSSSGNFAVAPNTVNLTAANFPVANVNHSYVVSISYSGIIEVGTGKTYETLTAENGFFQALAAGVVTSNLTVHITSDITESGDYALNQITEEGTTGSTVTIKPFEAARTLTFNKTGSCLHINQADNVIIDGRINGEGRFLTILNENTGGANVIDITGSSAKGATNITVRNVNVVGGSNSITSSYGIMVRDISGATTASTNSHNISLIDNTVKKAYYGIRVIGNGLNDIVISGNELGDADNAMTTTFRSIMLAGANAPIISGNRIVNQYISSGANNAGIELDGTNPITNAVISGNIIEGIYSMSSTGYGAYGISINSSGSTNTLIENNMISDIVCYGDGATSVSWAAFGIRLNAGTGIKIHHNTINMSGTIPSNSTKILRSTTIGVTATAVTGVDLVNNILINKTIHVHASSKSNAIWTPTNYTGVGIVNNNRYFVEGNRPEFAYVGSSVPDFASWQIESGLDANSTYGDVTFLSQNLAVIDGASIGDATLIKPMFTGMPLTDIHGETRTAANNFAGADIVVPTSVAIDTDLPANVKVGSNATYDMEFLPLVGNIFADGVARNPIPGHLHGMTYEWFHGATAIQSGVNDIVINNNVLTFEVINPTHDGNYYAVVTIGASSAQTGISNLEVETLEPTLDMPADLTTDLPTTVTLSWIAALDATDYNLQLSTDPTFQTNVINFTTTGTSYLAVNLEYYTDYFWRVQGFNTQNTSNWTPTWTFKTKPAIYPVALLLPADNSLDIEKEQTFTWNSVVDATEYELQIATDASFTTFHTNITLTTTSHTVELDYEGAYYWRVRGKNAVHNGLWSEERHFTVRPALFPIVMFHPINGINNADVNNFFAWYPNTDADYYRIEMATDANFQNIIDVTETDQISYIYYGFDFNTNYFWRVKAFNDEYESAWSEVWTFKTKVAPTGYTGIGNGTASAYQAPLNRYYIYSISEAIYLQSEIGTARTIQGIGYFKMSGTDLNPIHNVDILLKHTTASSLVSLSPIPTDSIFFADYTLVYSGSFPNNVASGWLAMDFHNTFDYNGTDNLQVLVLKGNQPWISTTLSPSWRYTTTPTTRQRQGQRDGGYPTSLTANTNLPDIAIGVPNPLLVLNAPTLTSPANMAIDVYMDHNFTWHAVTGGVLYKVQLATDAAFTNIIEEMDIQGTNTQFDNLLYETTHYWRVRAIAQGNVSPWSQAFSFTTTPRIMYGTYYVGEGVIAEFPNLTTVFNILNTEAKVAGDIELVIISDIEEPGTAMLNQCDEYFGTGHTITIRPDGNTLRTISANVPSGAVIKLMGADRIIFDGQADAQSDPFNLQLVNTNDGVSVALWLAATTGDFEGADNIEVRNMLISTMTSDINLYNSAGIFSGGPNTIGQTPVMANNYTIIDNNIFTRAKRGLLFQGGSFNRPVEVVISNNWFGSDEFEDILFSGIELYNMLEPLIENNVIVNTQNYGMNFNGSLNSIIQNNEIFTSKLDVYPGSVYGINISNSAGSVIERNIIKHFKTYGIFTQTSNNLVVENNSISNTGLMDNNIASVSGIYVTNGANHKVTIKGNKIFDISSTYYSAAANGAAYGISIFGTTITSAATPILIENNIIWNISGFGSVNPAYVQNNPYGIIIGAGRFINIYNNTVLMNGNLTSGTGISAAFFLTNPAVNNVNVRNNMFVNKMASSSATNYIYYLASNSPFASLDNNIYSLTGASNGKVGYMTSTSTAYNTLATWQSAISMDAASKMKTIPFLPNSPYVTYAVLGDQDFINPNILTTDDINGVTRTALNNLAGAYIPEFNDVQARYLIFNNITTTSMNMTWINGNGNGRLVLVSPKQLSSNDWYEIINNLNLEIDTYTNVNGSWNSRIPANFGTSTAYVIAQTSGASRTAGISGLAPSTRYYFHVVEYTTEAGITRYNPFPHTLNPRHIETMFDLTAPVVMPATNVAHDMFTANWTYSVGQSVDAFEMMLGGVIYDVAKLQGENGYYIDLFATPNTVYTYKVRAKKGGITGEWSQEQTVNTYLMNSLTGPAEVCLNAPIDYTLNLGNVVIDNVAWTSIGDATFVSTATGVTATWLADGSFNLSAFITDENDNTGLVEIPVFVKVLPVVECPANFEVCLSASPLQLIGAMPTGGVYSGTGVTNNMFDPATAGLGNHTITYLYTDATTGCENSCEFTVSVLNAITITVPANFEVCVDATPFALTGGMPEGGTYTGLVGVTGGMFNPTTAGIGDHTITYTYNDAYGCSNFATFVITVNTIPTLTVPTDFAVCIDSDPITLTATPTGGTFTGAHIVGDVFTPAVAGTYVITYYYEDAYGCSNSADFTITVDPRPIVTVENVALCIDAGATTLTANPMGGEFDGTGIVNGVFTPTAIGTFDATYTFTQGECTVVTPFTITVNPLPEITLPSDMVVCLNDAEFALLGATPIGGVYSGDGVTGGMFNPATAGEGVHTITYTFVDANTCENSATFTITVNEIPTITVPTDFAVCIDAAEFALLGATPAGGTYSGLGVSGGMFNPAIGAGTYTITYTAENTLGCSNSETFVITVNALPILASSGNLVKCISDAEFTLDVVTPAGGTYSGLGVSGGMFNPAVAGAGSHTITYEYTDNNGCTNSIDFAIDVTAAPLFTTQPESVWVIETTNATFTAATDNINDTYQWQENISGTGWVDINGATLATYTINAVTSADNGREFRVVATGCTESISNVVTLNVAIQSSKINFLNWGRSQITFNWTSGNGNGRIVVAIKADQWPNTDKFLPTDNTVYTGNSRFGLSSPFTIGANTFYVVYNGDGHGPLQVTGLERMATYSFHVFEYFKDDDIVIYNKDPWIGNPASRQTSRKEGNFDNDNIEIDANFSVSSVSPNPASDRIAFNIDNYAPAAFKVELVNLLGEVIYMTETDLSVGQHPIEINLRSERGEVPSGSYSIRIVSNGVAVTRNVVVVR